MFLFRFLRKQEGISSIEFTLVAALFLLFIFGIIDFSRVMYEWNQASKATQAGVRFAAVNNYASESVRTYSCPSGTTPGSSPPLGTLTGAPPNKIFCTNVGCGTAIDTVGGFGTGVDFFTPVVDAMRVHYPTIQAENVVIEFSEANRGDGTMAGMCGNPIGPDVDPLVTVRLRNMQFDLFTPLVSLFVSRIDMPDFPASLTGEDGRDTPPPSGGGGGP